MLCLFTSFTDFFVLRGAPQPRVHGWLAVSDSLPSVSPYLGWGLTSHHHHRHHMSAVDLVTTIFFQPQWSCTNSDSLSGPIVLSVSLTGTSTHLFLPYFLATVSLQITVMVTLNVEKKK